MFGVPTTGKNFNLTYLVDDKLPLGRALDFELPPSLEAAEPPEARGLSRDEVRLMVSYLHDNRVVHSAFRQIDQFFEARAAPSTPPCQRPGLTASTSNCISRPGYRATAGR